MLFHASRYSWIGGSDKRKEGDWVWSDNSKWSYTNWAPGQPDNKTGEDCLLTENGMWLDTSCDRNHTFMCEYQKVVTINSDTQLVFTADNTSKYDLQFTWKSQYSSKNTIGGFQLTWEIKQNNKSSEVVQERKIDNRSGVWKLKKGEESSYKIWPLVGFINLAEGLDKHNRTEAETWKALLKYKKEMPTGKRGAQCMSSLDIPYVLFELGEELNLNLDFNIWLPNDEYVTLGFQMYAALRYCPSYQDEAKRLSLFFESLLTDHSLGTVVAATFNNLEPRLGNRIHDYTTMNMWHNYLYKELDARYNFSLGPSVIALSTTEQLVELAKLDPPYLREYGQLEEATSEKLDLPGQKIYRRTVFRSRFYTVHHQSHKTKICTEIYNI